MSSRGIGIQLLARYLKLRDPKQRAFVGDCLTRFYEGPPNVELVLTCGGRCNLLPGLREREVWPKAAAELELRIAQMEARG